MKRFLLLGLVAFGLLLWGLATLNGGLLALAIPVAIYLGAALVYGPGKIKLEVTRTLDADRVLRGKPVLVRLAIANKGAPLEQVLIEDMLPRSLELSDGTPRALAALPHGETLELEYTVRGQRGQFEFSSVRVTACDRLGLFRRQATLPAPGRLMVLPETSRLRRVAIRPLRTRAYAGPIPSRQGGAGIEFFGVREYQPGDPPRRINWRASARHPRSLFANEFEPERIADVGLILDARQQSDVRLSDDALFEHAVRATSSLAETFLSDGNRVGLLIYGTSLEWTLPGYGLIQHECILRALAGAETGASEVFDSLDYIPTRYFPARSQIVLISPLCPKDLAVLVRLRARGYQLLVISPDPVAFEAKALAPQQDVALATRIARLERTVLLRRLQQAGIPVVDWQVHTPLDQAVLTSLGPRPFGFRVAGMTLWS